MLVALDIHHPTVAKRFVANVFEQNVRKLFPSTVRLETIATFQPNT